MAGRKRDGDPELITATAGRRKYAPEMEGYVSDLSNQLLADFRNRDQLLRDTEALIFRRHALEVPRAYEDSTIVVKAPIALDMVNSITAAMTVNPPEVNFEPVASGTQAQNNAELREKFFTSSWSRQEQEAGRQLYRAWMWNLVAYGEATVKTVERKFSAWSSYRKQAAQIEKRMTDRSDPEYGSYADGGENAHKREQTAQQLKDEAKKAAPYPIKSTDVPPEQFYYWLGESGYTIAGEIKAVPYLDCLVRFDAGLGTNGRVVPEEHMGLPRSQWPQVMSGVSTVDLVELWDWEWCHYCLIGPGQGASGAGSKIGRGTIVRSIRHGYGIPQTKTMRGPYFRAGGVTTGTREPETTNLGVLYGFLDLFKLNDQLLTLSSNAAFMTGYPAYKRNAPPGASMASAIGAAAGPGVAPFGIDGGERDAERPVRVVPGEVLPFDVSPVEPPKTGVDLQKSGEQINSILNRILPPALTGQDTGTSGYQLNQSAYLGSLRYSPILKNAEFALGQRTGFESWLIGERIGEKVYAWGPMPTVTPRRGYNPGARGTREGWLGVGPDDLNGAHRYRVALDAEVPSNRILEVRTQVEMLTAGLTSRTQAMEELGQDPGAVERQLLVENMKRSPEIQKRLQDRVFQLLGMGEEQQLAELGGPPSGPGANPGGPPMPGMGGPPGGPGGLANGAPDAMAPGQGMPLVPPPPGGGPGAAMPPGGLPGNPGGAPSGVMGPPPNALPLPGQQMGV
jgi:hypothetical protein